MVKAGTERFFAGLWTPTALVLCYKCHGPNFGSRGKMPRPEFYRMCRPLPKKPAEGEMTTCQKCRAPIYVRFDVARLHNLVLDARRLLREQDAPVVRMEQTGGMCAAVEADLRGGQRLAAYELEEDAPRFGLWLYASAEDPNGAPFGIAGNASEFCDALRAAQDGAPLVHASVIRSHTNHSGGERLVGYAHRGRFVVTEPDAKLEGADVVPEDAVMVTGCRGGCAEADRKRREDGDKLMLMDQCSRCGLALPPAGTDTTFRQEGGSQ